MRVRLKDLRNDAWRYGGGVVLTGSLAFAADPPALKLLDVSGPQLRPIVAERSTSTIATNRGAPVEEMALQTKAATDINLLMQRHEAMNGSALLSPRVQPRDSSRFQRTLDSFLPRNGAFFQGNPNALSSPLNRSEYWTK